MIEEKPLFMEEKHWGWKLALDRAPLFLSHIMLFFLPLQSLQDHSRNFWISQATFWLLLALIAWSVFFQSIFRIKSFEIHTALWKPWTLLFLYGTLIWIWNRPERTEAVLEYFFFWGPLLWFAACAVLHREYWRGENLLLVFLAGQILISGYEWWMWIFGRAPVSDAAVYALLSAWCLPWALALETKKRFFYFSCVMFTFLMMAVICFAEKPNLQFGLGLSLLVLWVFAFGGWNSLGFPKRRFFRELLFFTIAFLILDFEKLTKIGGIFSKVNREIIPVSWEWGGLFFGHGGSWKALGEKQFVFGLKVFFQWGIFGSALWLFFIWRIVRFWFFLYKKHVLSRRWSVGFFAVCSGFVFSVVFAAESLVEFSWIGFWMMAALLVPFSEQAGKKPNAGWVSRKMSVAPRRMAIVFFAAALFLTLGVVELVENGMPHSFKEVGN